MGEDMIDEAAVIAWLDGELDAPRAAEVQAAVAADPALTALAEAHRGMKTRFASAFGPIGEQPVAMPKAEPAAIISLAAARAARDARQKAGTAKTTRWRWAMPGAIAASLVAAFIFIQPIAMPTGSSGGIGDKAGALALAAPIAKALDGQLSGKVGAVRVALSFRGKDGQYCRSFAATHLAGIACREGANWQLRYASPDGGSDAEYRQAGDDAAQGDVVAAMIAGEPLDAAGETRARDAGWK